MKSDVDNFEKLLGIKVVEVKDEYAKTSVEVTKNHTNFIGIAHGGLIFTLADSAFAKAVNSGEKVGVAIQVNINFLKATHEGDVLTAEAVKISESQRLGLYHIKVYDARHELIASFSGTAYYIKNE
jgi:acyl-CoA thioesterase